MAFLLQQRSEWRECAIQKPFGKAPHMKGTAGAKTSKPVLDGLLDSNQTSMAEGKMGGGPGRDKKWGVTWGGEAW